MLTVACCLWDANKTSYDFSRCYDESWVEKLFSGFHRNLNYEFKFVCFTDRVRKFSDGIEQIPLRKSPPDYSCLIEPYLLNEPSIIVGLDTIVLRNIDHLADYCFDGNRIALPVHRGKPNCGVALVPQGHRAVFDNYRGENDMEWVCKHPHEAIDDLWEGDVVSYKLDVRPNGLNGARIVYFHGKPKPNELDLDWIRDNWC